MKKLTFIAVVACAFLMASCVTQKAEKYAQQIAELAKTQDEAGYSALKTEMDAYVAELSVEDTAKFNEAFAKMNDSLLVSPIKARTNEFVQQTANIMSAGDKAGAAALKEEITKYRASLLSDYQVIFNEIYTESIKKQANEFVQQAANIVSAGDKAGAAALKEEITKYKASLLSDYQVIFKEIYTESIKKQAEVFGSQKVSIYVKRVKDDNSWKSTESKLKKETSIYIATLPSEYSGIYNKLYNTAYYAALKNLAHEYARKARNSTDWDKTMELQKEWENLVYGIAWNYSYDDAKKLAEYFNAA